jgi:hypothetical protein
MTIFPMITSQKPNTGKSRFVMRPPWLQIFWRYLKNWDCNRDKWLTPIPLNRIGFMVLDSCPGFCIWEVFRKP